MEDDLGFFPDNESFESPCPEKLYACEDIPELGEGAKIIRIGQYYFIKKGNRLMTVSEPASFILDDERIRYAKMSDL